MPGSLPWGTRVSGNIAALLFLQVLVYATPLLTIPHLVRALGPAQYGLLTFAQAVVLHLDLLTDYGFNVSSARAVAVLRNDRAQLSQVFWTTLAAKLCILLACFLVTAAAVLCSPKLFAARWLYAACFAAVLGTALFPVWLFRGLEQFRLLAAVFGSARVLTIPLIYLFVHQPRDLLAAALIQSTVEIAATIFVLPFLRRSVDWYRPSLPEIRHRLREGWPLFLAGSALFLCTSSTTLLLGLTAGNLAVAYYAAADKLIKACSAMLHPLSEALYPFIAVTRAQSSDSAIQLIRRSLLLTSVVGCLVSVTTCILARPITHLLLGPAFAQSADLLRLLSPLPALFAITEVLGTQTLVVFEMDRVMSRIIMACAAAGIPLTLAFSWAVGATGAAFANLIVSSVMVLSMALAIHSNGLPVFWRQHSPVHE